MSDLFTFVLFIPAFFIFFCSLAVFFCQPSRPARWGRFVADASDVAEMGESWLAGDGSAVGGLTGSVEGACAWMGAAARVGVSSIR